MGSLRGVILFGIWLAGAQLWASDISYKVLRTQDDIIRERCRIDSHPLGSCNSSNIITMVIVQISGATGLSIARDIDEALQRGWAQELSFQDFFHGHWILRGPQTYSSFEEYLANVSGRLYHSAEYTDRWKKEARQGLPADQRTPRSFANLEDSGLQRAHDLVSPQAMQRMRIYLSVGTIYAEDIVAAHPELTELNHKPFFKQNPRVTFCDEGACQQCEADDAFKFIPNPNGAYLTSAGIRYELFFNCYIRRQ